MYIIGGLFYELQDKTSLEVECKTIEVLDTRSNGNWVELVQMKTARKYFKSFFHKDQLYLIGGYAKDESGYLFKENKPNKCNT